jgi:hypothetical protein
LNNNTRWLPHLTPWVNHVRVATYFCILYAALLMTFMAYAPGVDTNDDNARQSFK